MCTEGLGFLQQGCFSWPIPLGFTAELYRHTLGLPFLSKEHITLEGGGLGSGDKILPPCPWSFFFRAEWHFPSSPYPASQSMGCNGFSALDITLWGDTVFLQAISFT